MKFGMDVKTQSKLMTLYLLRKVNLALSKEQLHTFFEEKGAERLAVFEETLRELTEAEFVTKEVIRDQDYFEITEQGEQGLFYFLKDIPEEVQNDLDRYIEVHRFQVRTNTGVLVETERTEDLDYNVHLRVREGKTTLMDLRLSVPTEEQAELMEKHLESHAKDIYSHIMKMLI